MNKKLISFFAVVLCVSLLVFASIAASATELEDSSADTSVTSVNADVSTVESNNDDTESGTDTDINSQEQTSSEDVSSAEKAESSESPTSSSTTSSKVNKPIHSGGMSGSGTFVDNVPSQNVSTEIEEPISSEYVEGTDEEIDYYQGKATTVASDIYKIIWIPAVISVLCIAALVTVNVMFRKKYPKAKSGATRTSRTSKSSSTAPKRRGQK